MGSWDNPVDTTTGFLGFFRGTVKDAYAGTDPRYNDGKTTMAHWSVEVTEVLQDWDGDDVEEVLQKYPLGNGWWTEDGQTVEHERGKDRYHVSSIYGKIIANVSGLLENYGKNAKRTDGEELAVDLTSLADVLAERGDPQDMGIWKDLTLEFAEIEFDFGTNKDGEEMKAVRSMPIAVVGEIGKSKSAAKPKNTNTAKKNGKSSKASKPSTADRVAEAKARAAAAKKDEEAGDSTGFDFSSLGADEDQVTRLQEALDTAGNYDEFVNAILDMDDVVGDDELLNKLVNDNEGPWAQTHS